MEFATPVTLEDEWVRLEPLRPEHSDALSAATVGLEHTWYTSVPQDAAALAEDIRMRLDLHAAGGMNPFVVVDRRSGEVVGETSFCNIDQPNHRVEIGYTWLAPATHRTRVNPAAKRLLLAHAFDSCDAIAVELRTHWLNRQSRAAIEKLGAKQDGVLRSHRIMPDGSLRDTVVYSILAHEWPAVRNGLDARLAR